MTFVDSAREFFALKMFVFPALEEQLNDLHHRLQRSKTEAPPLPYNQHLSP